MGGFRHRSLHVKMKHRFCTARALFGQASPPSVAHVRRAVAECALADEIHVGVIVVSWPVMLEIVEKTRPVRLEAMHLEIAQRKREAVVDTDQRGRMLRRAVRLAIRRCRAGSSICARLVVNYLDGQRCSIRRIDAQTF